MHKTRPKPWTVLAWILALFLLTWTALSPGAMLDLGGFLWHVLVFLLLVPSVLYFTVIHGRGWKISPSVVSLILIVSLGLGLLTQPATVAASPDVYYLHDANTSGISSAGKYMNATQGPGGATMTFDTPGQTAYWYTDSTLISGIDPGPYTLHMYFNDLPSPWWNSSYQYRQNIAITAGSAAVPTNYSVPLTLDHAALVTAGKSQADGDDVRVLYWNGTGWLELDRALGASSSWDTASTKIWFELQATIAATASTNNYYLYYGNIAAANPPSNKSNIYLFFDDFEGGDLSKWTIASGLWQVATDQPRTGTYSLKYPEEAAADSHIDANPALDEADVYFEAWWRFTNPTTTDIAQLFRRNAANHDGYETVKPPSTLGWGIAKEIGGVFSWIEFERGTPAANTWTRIGIAIDGTGMRVFQDGTQTNPVSGSRDVGTELASGNVGFRKYNIGTGEAWWIDDVVVRKYVDPEPIPALGMEETEANVRITVGVVHTGPDGTDPRQIVTSPTVTIDSNTADPFALNVGFGAQQNFSVSDPRRLRLLITVTAITGGVRFVLAYDSGADPSRLDTPETTPNDTTPPAAITDLTTSNSTMDPITLTWTAPGDDGSAGTATGYVAKYSISGPITDATWDAATTYPQAWTPLSASSTENRVVSGLSSSSTFWFAIKAYDEVPNYGGISNSPSGTTATPEDGGAGSYSWFLLLGLVVGGLVLAILLVTTRTLRRRRKGGRGQSPLMSRTSTEVEDIKPGKVYLLEEEKPEHVVAVFNRLGEGQKHIAVTRANPRSLIEEKGLRAGRVLWLAERASPSDLYEVVPPSLEKLMYILENHAREVGAAVVMIDGIEYLVDNNSFNSVLRFLRRLVDLVSESDAILLVSLSPKALSEKELKILEREMEVVLPT